MSVSAVLALGGTLIDKFFPDPAEAAKRKLDLVAMEQSGELSKIAESVKVVTAEAKSEHFLVAAWRPITMLTFVAIIANNYMLYPYMSLFWDAAPKLTLPPDMWDLLKIGLGGYVVGRSVEKTAKGWKGN